MGVAPSTVGDIRLQKISGESDGDAARLPCLREFFFFLVCSQFPPETPNTVAQRPPTRPDQKSSGGSQRGQRVPSQPPSRGASLSPSLVTCTSTTTGLPVTCWPAPHFRSLKSGSDDRTRAGGHNIPDARGRSRRGRDAGGPRRRGGLLNPLLTSASVVY